MTTYLAALSPLLLVMLRGPRWTRVASVAAFGLGMALNWRVTLIGFGPLLIAFGLVRFLPRPWNEDSERSAYLNAMWAMARLLTIPIPIGAGLLLAHGVPRVLPTVDDFGFNTKTIVLGAVTFLVADFTNYWTHRLRHAVPWLWRFHEIHHSDQALSVLSARRLHVVDQLIARTIRILPVALFGPQYLFGFLSWALVRGAAGYYHHGGSRFGGPRFELVFTTPFVHRLHHSTRSEHFDTNFGGVLIIWDRLFGTFTPGIEDVVPTGVLGTDLENELESDRPLWRVMIAQFVYPFRGAWQDARAWRPVALLRS